MTKQTLILLKPDAVQRSLIGEIIRRIEKKGLKIVALKMLAVSPALAEKLYEVHKDKKFYTDLMLYITSGPIVAMVVEGEQVVEVVRLLIGSTDGAKASPGTIRGDFALNIQKNVIHASDSEERAKFEISIFFNSAEILNYKKSDMNWIY
ncbi:MAG: nucleoside-diphosphate kinase [Thermoplasmata archaeon]